MDVYITHYHRLGFTQQEILLCLAMHHNIFISDRSLRRKLKMLNLFRRKHFSNVEVIVNFLRRQIETHGQLHGYKWMHMKCLQHGLTVTQATVRQILQVLDPEGVNVRSRKRLRRRQYYSKGPNYLWHMDCYDKLKPYGISITGCIDGFSRYIIWLGAEKSTNNPRTIANYFFHAIEDLHGCPHTIRADMGTENTLVEQLQTFLRADNLQEDGLPCFLYGTSTTNQRIEAWWSMLRKHHSQFWMNLFQNIKDIGLFNGSFLDKSLIQFCFLKIIQNELNTVVQEWNTHRISASRNSIAPKGRPFVMYHFPEIYETRDYKFSVETEDLLICSQLVTSNLFPCDEDVYELAQLIMNEERLEMATDPHSGVDLYVNLRTKFLTYFN